MDLVTTLRVHRPDREAALWSRWKGPVNYEPYRFFSVFVLLKWQRSMTSVLFLFPFCAINLYSIAWTTVLQLVIQRCADPPCETPPMLATMSSLAGFMALIQVAMLLLLTFRLQRAAVRFYDCRAACGKMIEYCRNFASEASVYCSHDPALRDQIIKWVAAAPVAIKNFLRKDSGDPQELLGILSDAECTQLFQAPHQPLLVWDVLRMYVFQMATDSPLEPMLSATAFKTMSDSINGLNSALGMLERLASTPLPFIYVAFLRVTMTGYLILLPLTVGQAWGWYSILVELVLSWVMLGIEASATECERPMLRRSNHMPIERYCLVVMDNVQQVLETVSKANPGNTVGRARPSPMSPGSMLPPALSLSLDLAESPRKDVPLVHNAFHRGETPPSGQSDGFVQH